MSTKNLLDRFNAMAPLGEVVKRFSSWDYHQKGSQKLFIYSFDV